MISAAPSSLTVLLIDDCPVAEQGGIVVGEALQTVEGEGGAYSLHRTVPAVGKGFYGPESGGGLHQENI